MHGTGCVEVVNLYIAMKAKSGSSAQNSWLISEVSCQ